MHPFKLSVYQPKSQSNKNKHKFSYKNFVEIKELQIIYNSTSKNKTLKVSNFVEKLLYLC